MSRRSCEGGSTKPQLRATFAQPSAPFGRPECHPSRGPRRALAQTTAALRTAPAHASRRPCRAEASERRRKRKRRREHKIGQNPDESSPQNPRQNYLPTITRRDTRRPAGHRPSCRAITSSRRRMNFELQTFSARFYKIPCLHGRKMGPIKPRRPMPPIRCLRLIRPIPHRRDSFLRTAVTKNSSRTQKRKSFTTPPCGSATVSSTRGPAPMTRWCKPRGAETKISPRAAQRLPALADKRRATLGQAPNIFLILARSAASSTRASRLHQSGKPAHPQCRQHPTRADMKPKIPPQKTSGLYQVQLSDTDVKLPAFASARQ